MHEPAHARFGRNATPERCLPVREPWAPRPNAPQHQVSGVGWLEKHRTVPFTRPRCDTVCLQAGRPQLPDRCQTFLCTEAANGEARECDAVAWVTISNKERVYDAQAVMRSLRSGPNVASRLHEPKSCK